MLWEWNFSASSGHVSIKADVLIIQLPFFITNRILKLLAFVETSNYCCVVYDMIWYDIWYDVIWYDIWCYMIWYDTILHNTILYYTILYDTIRYDTLWYMIWYMIYVMIYMMILYLLTTTGFPPASLAGKFVHD